MAKNNKETEKSNTPQQAKKKQQGQLVTYFMIFVFGFLSGIAFTVYKGPSSGVAPSTVAQGQSEPHDHETEQAIINLEADVTANPENFESWVRLGHLYYDSNQPEKAIAAYNKSLEFHSGDANLLTDLGVMYRRTKQPEKAIDLFNEAIKKDPAHLPSRFNKGIVLMYDLNDPKEALAAWEELLKINPQAKTASGQPIIEFVEKIKAEQPSNQ
ncbi:MAG: tetratricopeptide repeat protein [Desulforhopalus sp.]